MTEAAASAERPEPRTPLVSIRGDASPEEVAALVAVVQGLASAAADAAAAAAARAPRRSTWADPARRVRGSHASGPGAWRASGLPR